MLHDVDIRDSTPGDRHAIEALYRDTFTNEDLVSLVQSLMTGKHDVLSHLATAGSSVIAHVMFTNGRIDQSGPAVALLGPLGVASFWQRQGVGTQIVRSGIERLTHKGIGHVFVLGDPAYYQRFGFIQNKHVAPPYPLPKDWNGAWQSLNLNDNDTPAAGKISLPEPWLRKELWLP